LPPPETEVNKGTDVGQEERADDGEYEMDPGDERKVGEVVTARWEGEDSF